MTTAARLGLALGVLLLAGCASGGEDGDASELTRGSADSDGRIAPELLQPLVGLGPCEDPPPANPDAAAATELPGVALPPTTVITHLNDTGPLTQIRGYVERTPVEMRKFYSDGSTDLEVLTIEDEIREVEVLLTDGDTRLFVKGQAVCERGSFFTAFLAPAGQAELLPSPALGGN